MQRISLVVLEVSVTALVILLPAVIVLAETIDADFTNQLAAGEQAYKQSNYQAAEQELLEAVKTAEGFKQPDTRLATALNDLGMVYQAEQRFRDANNSRERALRIIEEANGK
jgi:tetratricopeptide (TPR) repeat protein